MFNCRLIKKSIFVLLAEPYYEQWRSLHNKKLDEVIEDNRESKTHNSKKKRMFKMELTDGYKTIHAMEMKQIACLNTKLTPGIKILFIGPIQVCNHLMMIKPDNIKIVGGEVEELLIINAYENVLLRLLNKPTVDNPILNYAEHSVENEKTSNSVPKNLVEIKEQKINPRTEVKKPQNIQQNSYIDDIDDDMIDLAAIEAIEEQVLNNSEEKKQPVTSGMIIDDDIDDYILAEINLEDDKFMQQNSNQQQPEPSVARKRKSVDSPERNVNKLTKSIKLSEQPQSTIVDNDYPYKIDDKFNFITIDQYCELKMRDKMEKEYALEINIDQVLKIKATENEWLLIVQIEDAYSKNKLSVRFADEIVTEFGKRSAKELHLLKRQMCSGQPQLKMDIENTLDSINKALQVSPLLICIQMKVKLPVDYENVITKVLKKTDRNREMISLKVQREGISLE